MKEILILTILSLVISPLAVCAQVSEKDFASDLDAFVRKTMEAFPEIPSVAIVVVKDDKPIFIQAYGFANKEKGIRADKNTLYYNGSSTKSYTALAAALLDREGKIKLSDPITKYAPGVTFKTSIPEKLTVQNLLTHTSALRNSPLVFRTAFSGQIDDRDLMRVFAEGTTYNDQNFGKYAYTNLGYNIYGLLLQRSLGKRWQDVLQEKVFEPLKLKQTAASITRARAAKLTVADSYIFDPGSERVIRSPIDKLDNNMQAAGGMYTSLNDLGRWLNVNMNNGRIDGKQVIPTDVMERVHTGYADTVRDEPPFTGSGKYGLGWQIGKYRDENVIYHHGGYTGWNSHVSYMPDRKIGVGVMVNEGTVGGRAGHLLAAYAYDRWLGTATTESYEKQLQALAEQYGKGKQAQIASFRERAKRTSQLTRPLTDYVGRYSNDMLGDIDIAVENNSLGVRFGNIHVVSTPFTQKETIRVEMIPGEGEVIKFETSADGRVEALSYGGMTFRKK
jgi:CubicO group peptidase (beta-lactamase class C family)